MQENIWAEMESLPQVNVGFGSLAATVDGQIYFFAGDNSAMRYNPESNTWTEITPIPTGLGCAAVAYQNKIYVIGNPTQVYDPITDSWHNKTGLPETILGCKAEVVNDKIYVISGGKPAPLGVVSTSEVTYVYEPATDSWSTMKPIPTPVQSYASAVLDGKIYIIGGETVPDYNSDMTSSKLVQIFDPVTDQWTTGPDLLFGVNGEGAVSTSGINASKRIYVMGGLSYYYGLGTSADLNPQTTFANQVYDPEAGKWSTAAPFPDVRWNFAVVNVNDLLYVVGGSHAESVHGSNWVSYSNGVNVTYRYVPLGYVGSQPTPTQTTATSPLITENPLYTPPYLFVGIILVVIVLAGISFMFYKRR